MLSHTGHVCLHVHDEILNQPFSQIRVAVSSSRHHLTAALHGEHSGRPQSKAPPPRPSCLLIHLSTPLSPHRTAPTGRGRGRIRRVQGVGGREKGLHLDAVGHNGQLQQLAEIGSNLLAALQDKPF